ncbi:gephyrin [Plakobranchus ocellatus]|uniref:Gephyrin n=1 Tax=Plakobranchus ocellatus TaxID=259542 RepID=A0AAV3Y527_9GAST|nr:gephyrin [Plakobranchus ocellatus]
MNLNRVQPWKVRAQVSPRLSVLSQERAWSCRPCVYNLVCQSFPPGGIVGRVWEDPQQGDLRFSGHPPGQGADGGARNCDRSVPAALGRIRYPLCYGHS